MNPLVQKYREQREAEKAAFYEKIQSFFGKNKKSDVATDYDTSKDYTLTRPKDLYPERKYSEDEPGGLNNSKATKKVKVDKDEHDNADVETRSAAQKTVEQGKDEEKKKGDSSLEQRRKPVHIVEPYGRENLKSEQDARKEEVELKFKEKDRKGKIEAQEQDEDPDLPIGKKKKHGSLYEGDHSKLDLMEQ